MLSLDEEVGKASERQMAPHHVAFVGSSDWKMGHPAYFEEGHRALLQRWIAHGHQLPVLGFSVEQEQDTVRAEVQRIGFAGRRNRRLTLSIHEFVDTASSDGKPRIDAAIALSRRQGFAYLFIHSQRRWRERRFGGAPQRSEDSVDKVGIHTGLTIFELFNANTCSYRKQFKCLGRKMRGLS